MLEGIDHAWREQRGELESAGARLVGQLAEQARNSVGPAPQPDLLDAAVTLIEQAFDHHNGGWGGAPKFPQPMTIEFLLRRAAAGDRRALQIARRSLDKMADGGLRDQLGGGSTATRDGRGWAGPPRADAYENASSTAYLCLALRAGRFGAARRERSDSSGA